MLTRRPERQRTVVVLVSTAVEMLLSLYRAYSPVFEDIDTQVPTRVPDAELHGDAIRFFVGDVALGNNLVALALEQGWTDSRELTFGLSAMGAEELLHVLLRSPDASRGAISRRSALVSRAATEADARASVAAELEAEGFDRDAVEWLMSDLEQARLTLLEALASFAQRFAQVEPDLRQSLELAAERARYRIGARGLQAVLRELTGGWTLREVDHFARVVLTPSIHIAPFNLTRVNEPESAFVVFPAPDDGRNATLVLANQLRALANPHRLEILRCISARPAIGQDLAEVVGLTEPTVHHHLSALRSAGLITSVRGGNSLLHETSEEMFEHLWDGLRDYVFGTGAPRTGDRGRRAQHLTGSDVDHPTRPRS